MYDKGCNHTPQCHQTSKFKVYLYDKNKKDI